MAIAVGRLEAGAWSTGDVVLALQFPADDRVSARLTSRALVLPAPLQAVRSASLDCPQAKVGAGGITCASAELRLDSASGESLRVPLAMDLMRGVHGWRLRLAADKLPPGPVWRFMAAQGVVPPGIDFGAGTLTVSLGLHADADGPRAEARAELSDLTFSDARGLRAGEGLEARLEAALSKVDDAWGTKVEIELTGGQLYVDPVFVDAGVAPLALSVDAGAEGDAPALPAARWRIHQRGLVDVSGTVRMTESGDADALDLVLARVPVAPVYRTYLQPFAIGTPLDTLELAGEMEARVSWGAREGWGVRLGLYDVALDDGAGRFSLAGLEGRLAWNESGDAGPTRLAWSGGRLYRIDFGAGALAGRLAGRRFDLDAPVRVPSLEGAVTVDALEVAGIGTDDVRWRFRGGVDPMSLRALTAALEWPAFGGTLGGDIPLVNYADGVITVEGSLAMQVFQGAVRIRGLSVTDPFGIVPVLRADVDFTDLSLDALTSTFSFGNIEGKLQGRVHGLVLKDWKPAAFDARFATPDDDDSRHRISQRAVEDLASLGGAGAVLSTTFLRLFEEFSYRRLGISCRLHRGVCEMGGVAPAERGYYIVEGGGLPPRIDVLGFNRRVDWEVLLGRIGQIVTSEGPVVR